MDEKGNSRPRVNYKGPLKVTMSEHPQNRAEVVGLWAGTLAATEVGLGSILHGLHVPLAGSMLSLNQAAFLTRATRTAGNYQTARTLPFEISSITAVLKSFSPIGKKLTPMLAITAQGALFSLATVIFGANLLGVMIGSVLLATWGVIQPLAIAGLMFWSLSGSEQEKIIISWQKLTGELPFLNPENVGLAVACFLILKCSLALAIAAATWSLSPGHQSSWFTAWVNRLTRAWVEKGPPAMSGSADEPSKKSLTLYNNNPLIDALRDLMRPLVLISLGILIALSVLVNSDLVDTFWITMRALGAAYATYVILRWLPWDRLLVGNSASKTALRSAVKRLHLIQINNNEDIVETLRQVHP